ncbi:MAG TPA: hypothetical protein VGO00_04365, partial [Kofleriaceae bacterium]|nr:hypothetical protein [Kofleriaceae bacterium]
KLTCDATVGAALSVKPNWPKIIGDKLIDGAIDAVEDGAKTLGERLLTATVAEIAGFAAIAASIGLELVMGAKALAKMEHTEAEIQRATAAYASGGLTALGVAVPASAKYVQFWVAGQAAYAKTVPAMAAKIISAMNDPDLAAGDVVTALNQAAQNHAHDLRAKIEGAAKPNIANTYAKAYYAEESASKLTFNSDVRREAQAIANHEGGSESLDVDGKGSE